MEREKFARLIDHTSVKIDTTLGDIKQICAEAKKYGFGAVVANSCYLPYVKREVQGTEIKPVATIAFPFGAALTESKIAEVKEAIRQGAQELDVVMNLGLFKSGEFGKAKQDLQAVTESAREETKRLGTNSFVKVIIETSYLNNKEIEHATKLAVDAGADMIKTSTGFGPRGVIPEDIKVIKKVAGNRVGIKASGGIKTFDQAMKLILEGATRIGASRSIEILEGWH
jgi:deoxyribose-phosphate aldolase